MPSTVRDQLQAVETLGLRYALALPQSALAGLSGTRVGRRAGSSIDFQDYREYQHGDDLRSIDWNVFARSDRLTIKLFREEVNPHLDLVLDGSRSMNLDGSEKSSALVRMAAALAMAAENAQCTHAAWLAGDGFQRLANDALRPSAWDGFTFESRRNMEESFAILPPRLRRLGIRVLVSDLLWPGNPVQTLRRLSDSAAGVIVVQLLARADVEPPEHGNIHLVDSETGEALDLFIDAMTASQYRDNLARHQQAWHDACRQCGARLVPVVAEDFEASLEALEEAAVLVPA